MNTMQFYIKIQQSKFRSKLRIEKTSTSKISQMIVCRSHWVSFATKEYIQVFYICCLNEIILIMFFHALNS